MKFFINFIVFVSIINGFSQEKLNYEAIDSLYREDQFYVGITYNNLQNKNDNIKQGRFTTSYSIGFLRDMPINKNRTFAFAAGVGYAINDYNVNFRITESNNTFDYNPITTLFDKNKLVLHYVDVPLEIRWRTSTFDSHKFWRFYGGIKASFLVYDYSKYEDSDVLDFVYNNKDLNKIQLGTFVVVGYNNWNFNIYYGLNPIFKSAKLNNENLNIKTINFGLIFYIL